MQHRFVFVGLAILLQADAFTHVAEAVKAIVVTHHKEKKSQRARSEEKAENPVVEDAKAAVEMAALAGKVAAQTAAAVEKAQARKAQDFPPKVRTLPPSPTSQLGPDAQDLLARKAPEQEKEIAKNAEKTPAKEKEQDIVKKADKAVAKAEKKEKEAAASAVKTLKAPAKEEKKPVYETVAETLKQKYETKEIKKEKIPHAQRRMHTVVGRRGTPAHLESVVARRRMDTMRHQKEAGDGYKPGSPLYEHQEKRKLRKEESAAFHHFPMLCILAAPIALALSSL